MADRGRGRGRGRGRWQGDRRGHARGSSVGSASTTTTLPSHPRGGRDGRGGRGQSPGGGRGRGGQFGAPPGTDRGGIYRENDVPAPDASISDFENKTLKLKKEKGENERDTYLGRLPVRPAYGQEGRGITLRTNYFPLNLRDLNQKFYRYDISFVPETPALSRPKKRRYIELLLRNPLFQNAASDYSTIIITGQPVKFSNGNRQSFSIVTWDRYEQEFPSASPMEPEGRQAARQRRTRTLQVQYNTSYGIKELFEFVKSNQPGATYTATRDVVQAMNIVFSRATNLHPQVAKAGQNKFFPYSDTIVGSHPLEEAWQLGQGLKTLRGYYSSVRLGPNRVLMNINVASAAFYQEGTLNSSMMALSGRPDRSRGSMLDLQAFLKGVRVVTNYTRDDNAQPGQSKTKPRVHVIFSLATARHLDRNDQRPQLGANSQEVTFQWKNETTGQQRQVSVRQYFKENYNIDLKSWQAPVVNVGTKDKPNYIPPELCCVHGGQVARKTLSGTQTDAMLRFAARAPNLNAQSIEGPGLEVLEVSQAQQASSVGRFGLQMGTKMLTVPARMLAPVPIKFQQKTETPSDGGWNLRGQRFNRGATMGKFSGFQIQVEGRASTANLPEAFRKVATDLNRYGIKVENTMNPPNQPLLIKPLRKENWSDIAKKIDGQLQKAAQNGMKWLLISIPEKNGFIYAAIKTPADIKYGIHTVVIQDSNCAKISSPRGDPGLVGNLALKFCGKSGGLCWSLDPKGLALVDNETMLVGLDVTHPSPGSRQSAPSIVAIVASVDKELSCWPGNLRVQTSRREMVEKLNELMIERLRLFESRNNNRLPKKIIMFRDGVSEGQFGLVLNTEYPAMIEAFHELYGERSKHPKVSIVIVGKRHHTRFYPTAMDHTDPRSFNPKPGVVVDRHITGYGERLWDFYLQPHKALQGTAKPAHYIVIKNEIGFGHEQLEKLTHSLCYGFHRATKAVSICAPAYCADILAERGRCYLYEVMNDATGSESSFDPSTASWTGGVHSAIENSMFYI